MSIFLTNSVLERIHGPEKAKEMADQVVHTCGDASGALRKNYKATGEVLGEGAFGKVYKFESREEFGEPVAVKVLLKE